MYDNEFLAYVGHDYSKTTTTTHSPNPAAVLAPSNILIFNL